MKKHGVAHIILLSAACVLCNLAGKYLASIWSLPLWLDCIGTMFSAYILGPAFGAAVGLVSNVIWCYTDLMQCIYGLVSIIVGILIGLFGRRGSFTDASRTLEVGMLLAAVSAVVSVPLNFLFYAGATGNVWGDGVAALLEEYGIPNIAACAIGEFYIDFVDKILLCLLLYCLLEIKHKRHRHQTPKMAALALAFLFLPLFADSVTAEAAENTQDYNSYIQTTYSSTNGLTCGKATDIVQDNDGMLWVGTYAGLFRYDGSDFTMKTDYDSVKNANCLYVDQENRIWIGTNDNGLSICENDEITYVFNTANGSPSDSIRYITQASDGLYYIGTSDCMFTIRYNKDGEPEIAGTVPEVIYTSKGGDESIDDAGHVAVSTMAGDLFLLKDGKVIETLQGTSDLTFTCTTFDDEGKLWTGTANGNFLIFDVSSDTMKLERTLTIEENLGDINVMHMDDDGKMFVCGNGVGYFDTSDVFHMINTNSFDDSIEAMTVDYQGNLWFSSSRLGLLKLAPSSFSNLYTTVGLEGSVVNAISIWQDAIYVCTDNGLDIISGDCSTSITNSLTELLDGVRLRCVITDSDNNLWISTYGLGLLRVDEQGEITSYTNENGFLGNRVRFCTQLSDGSIVAASMDGLNFLRDGEIIATLPYTEGLSNTPVLTLTELGDGTLVAGTDGAGLAVIKDYKVVKTITKEDGLTFSVILRIVADRTGDGAFLVASNGISYLSTDLTVTDITNFPYSNNYDIVQNENGNDFVFSSAGVYVVNHEELKSNTKNMSYELLDSKRGLSGNLTSNAWRCIDSENNLYLPCDNGVFMMNLDNYHSVVTSYRMRINEAELDGSVVRIPAGEKLTVDRTVKRLTLYPEILNYSVEDPYVSYYLEGFETDTHVVQESELNSVTYTNLSPGTYVFHLCVLDDMQTSTVEEITCTVVKVKAIQDNAWFMFYFIVVLLAFAAMVTWFFVHASMDRRLKMAEKQVQMGNETIMAIAHTVDAKDSNTAHHSVRVSEYSVLIAKRLGMSDEECENLRKAALLHDIGKIAIPDSVLNKPARLTDEEYAVMKSHVDHGADILKDFTLVEHASEGAQYHHERYDGKGYTHGLKGEEIPLYARIIGIADAFDAMTANRVYRKKLDTEYVLGELHKGRGTQFDPKLLDIFLSLIDDKVIDMEAMYKDSEQS